MALADPEKSQTLCIKAANRVEACTRSISWHCRLDRVAKRADDLRLPVSGNVAVARKRRQNILVAEVLAPRLILFRRLADLATEKRQGLPEAVVLLPQVLNPLDNDLADIVADRKEPGRERLGELRLNLPCVLVDPALINIDVLE